MQICIDVFNGTQRKCTFMCCSVVLPGKLGQMHSAMLSCCQSCGTVCYAVLLANELNEHKLLGFDFED